MLASQGRHRSPFFVFVARLASMQADELKFEVQSLGVHRVFKGSVGLLPQYTSQSEQAAHHYTFRHSLTVNCKAVRCSFCPCLKAL